ncbi:MAG: T9SS type A sorting domain-containing protein [Prevotellaceae bacterium]|jgi:allantoicase|nr:T9SS type A sorting domain-containing protein [Prevotellaceae bacterium]
MPTFHSIETVDGVIPALKLYSLQGKLLLQTTANAIDLSVYPRGTYLLQVNNEAVKVMKK